MKITTLHCQTMKVDNCDGIINLKKERKIIGIVINWTFIIIVFVDVDVTTYSTI